MRREAQSARSPAKNGRVSAAVAHQTARRVFQDQSLLASERRNGVNPLRFGHDSIEIQFRTVGGPGDFMHCAERSVMRKNCPVS